MASSKWKLLDVSVLEPSHCYLPDDERRELYNKLTKTFTIDNETFDVHGLSTPDFGRTVTPQPIIQQIQTIVYYFIIIAFYFTPGLFMLLFMYLLYHAYYTRLVISILICLFLVFYPIPENRAILRNRFVYNQLKYFSYRLSCHEETYNYMRSVHSDLIFMAMPHGTLPLTTVISPLITTDTFAGKEAVGTTADIIFYIPFIRNFACWFGVVSASKQSIQNVLLNVKRCLSIVCDGIAGIFEQSTNVNTEVIFLKHRKGITKMALRCGCVGVVPMYGFGNCQVLECWFDKYGIMKAISKKLKMSLIVMYGRWYLWIPNRIPLYNVTGPIVRNKYANNPIKEPTQQQIDEYHDRILAETTKLFNQHKGIYGWSDKELVFK
eukprot:33944_1